MASDTSQQPLMNMPHPGVMDQNPYMLYHQRMPMMPSTSNGIMPNFSMDGSHVRNSGSPMMMHPPTQNSPMVSGVGPPNFMQGPPHPQQFPSSMPSFIPQNPPQYTSNGQSQQQNFSNPGMPPRYYSNAPQQPPSTASPSRLNNPNYPPSNASNANNTPTYPNHSGTPTYPNPSNMQQNNAPSYLNGQGSNYPQIMPNDFMQRQEDKGTNSEQMGQNYQNIEGNSQTVPYGNNMITDMNNFNGSGPFPPPPFQRQMSTNSNMPSGAPLKKASSNKTMLFTSEMLNEMASSCKNNESESLESWHTNYMSNNGNAKSSRKRKMESPSYPGCNNTVQDYNLSMAEFPSPMSNNSLPDVNGGGAMLNNSQMSSDNYGSKREKKDDDGPLQCIERMTQQTLDRSPKINNRLDTNKRQEDKKQKLAKLDLIANDLNIAPSEYCPQPMMRQMNLPPGMSPHMIMQMQSGMRSAFPPPPPYDPHMQNNVRPPMMIPQPGAMYNGMPPPSMAQNMMSPNLMQHSSSPAHSQNGMMPSYGGMAAASPKFNPMMSQPSMISPQQGNMGPPPPFQMMDGSMRPPMNEMMWQQQRRAAAMHMQMQQAGGPIPGQMQM